MTNPNLFLTGTSGSQFNKVTTNPFGTITTLTGVTALYGIAVDPANTFVYVADDSNGIISKINISTMTVVATVAIGFSNAAYCCAIDPSGTYLYTTFNNSNQFVYRTPLATFTLAATTHLTLAARPREIVIDPSGTFAYVNTTLGTLIKINLSTFAVAATLTGVATFGGMAIDPSGTYLYIGATSTTVKQITVSTLTLNATLTTPTTNGTYFAVDPAGTFLYISDGEATGHVYKVAVPSFSSIAATLGGFATPAWLLIDASGVNLYVVQNTLTYQVPLATFTLGSSVALGLRNQVAISSELVAAGNQIVMML